MSYYRIFGLKEEPFSTSPDPELFYESSEHKEALLRMEIAIKLKRGLSVILGDVGSGKTTLARKLCGIFSDKSRYEFGIILDPSPTQEAEFLSAVANAFGIQAGATTAFGYRKAIESYLFQKGVDEGKTVMLLIDEAQKLDFCTIESLRTLLNYETNKFKLLQLVLLGQMELLPMVSQVKNFWERIAMRYVINPLSRDEAQEMIEFRLKQAGYCSVAPLFDIGALDAIYHYTQGCPRRICHLCHDALEMIVMRDMGTVDREVIQDIMVEESGIMK